MGHGGRAHVRMRPVPGEIRAYFERFGGVKEVEMILDKATMRHKGFVFVTFEHEDALKQVLSRPHELRGKKVRTRLWY